MALHGLLLSLLATAMLFSLVVAQSSSSRCRNLLTVRPDLEVELGAGATTFTGPKGVYTLICKNYQYLDGPSAVRCINGRWEPDPLKTRCTVCNEKLGRRLVNNATHGDSCICDDIPNPCDKLGEVCGTDARTYATKCHLEKTRCDEGRLLDVAHTGPCEYGGVCALPKPSGSCNAYEKRWYYNLQRTRCEQFDYGQCFVGNNVFETRHECYRHCECDVWCKQPCDPGPCKHNETTERFYFEPEIDTCKSMRYSGCGGNENNFDSHRNCMTTCQIQRNSPAPSDICLNRHQTTLPQACGNQNATTFLATISVDSDEVERFGNNGYIVMLWHKFFGNDRVVNDNQEFLVNLSERCPCLSLLKGQQYLVSGVVRRFGSTPRLAIHDGSLVMPYNSFVDIKAAVNTIVGCNTAGDK